MKINHTRWVAAGVIVATLGLTACSATPSTSSSSSTSSAAADLGSLTLQLPWIRNSQFIGEDLAIENGYFADAGLDDVSLITGPSTGISEILSGTADVGMIDAVTVGSAIANQDAPIKIIGSTYQKNPYSVLSLAANPINEPEDLVGKKIGVQAANTALFDALLAATGVSPDDVTIVPVDYDVSPLINGDIDGYVSFLTNESISIREQAVDAVDMPFADHGLPFVADAIIATDDAIANNRDALVAFLQGEVQGYAAALKDPQAGIDLMMSQTGTDLGLDAAVELKCAVAANTQLIATDETAANGLLTTSDELQAETIATLAATGVDLKADDVFDMSLLDDMYKAHPELVDYAS